LKSDKKLPPKPPAISPYVFTFLLIFFGLWCFYDGWLTTDPDMIKHALFNRVLSIVLLPWGIYDFYKVRKNSKKRQNSLDKKESSVDKKDGNLDKKEGNLAKKEGNNISHKDYSVKTGEDEDAGIN